MNTLKSHLINFTFIRSIFSTVPIIPEFLYDIRHPDAPLSSFSKSPPHHIATTSGYELEGDGVTTAGYGQKDFL